MLCFESCMAEIGRNLCIKIQSPGGCAASLVTRLIRSFLQSGNMHQYTCTHSALAQFACFLQSTNMHQCACMHSAPAQYACLHSAHASYTCMNACMRICRKCVNVRNAECACIAHVNIGDPHINTTGMRSNLVRSPVACRNVSGYVRVRECMYKRA